MTITGEVKRESSPWANGVSDELREIVEKASQEYVTFEEFWLAAMSQLENEAELTETMELVAELRGWSGQLVRRRRTADGKSAEKGADLPQAEMMLSSTVFLKRARQAVLRSTQTGST